MLEIMLLNYEALYFVSFTVCFTFATILLSCVCCRKPRQKNDLLGLDGMVKITNPDENVNHMPSTANCISVNVTNDVHFTTNHEFMNESSTKSRTLGNSNPNRSLPEIPVCPQPGTEMNADASSEIYATVEDKSANQPSTKNYSEEDYNQYKTVISANGNNLTRPSLSQQSSLSQADPPYARLKSEHPYDKLKKSEHPYARVQCSNLTLSENKLSDNSNRVGISSDELQVVSHSPTVQRTSTVSLANPESNDRGPTAPPRSRRTSSHCSLPITTTDIPAATAVAGQIAASQELPYMTPPPLQPNFSGDSQDSSKGYTSISVREPLANIRALIPAISNSTSKRPELSDPHYATVSDDSDEMYAAIEEPNQQLYTNGSDTYAQIQPMCDVNNTLLLTKITTVLDRNDTEQGQSSAPQPPSVDSLRQVAQVHSRQASSSSCTSSVANLGSPKPEKRQANSPLPPRPSISPELRSSSAEKNLEDMYAKVHKTGKKKKDLDDIEQRVSTVECDEGELSRNSVPNINFDLSGANFSQKLNSQVDVMSRKSWTTKEVVDIFQKDKLDHGKLESMFNSDPDLIKEAKAYNRTNSSKSMFDDHCYETLNKNDIKGFSPKKDKFFNNNCYENTNQHLPPIASIKCDTQVSGPESLLSNDPGYEVLNHNRPPSDCDPNYEVLRPQKNEKKTESEQGYSTINISKTKYAPHNHSKTSDHQKLSSNSLCDNVSPDPLYSIINKLSKDLHAGYETVQISQIENLQNVNESIEPNYESMPHECTEEPNYATVQDKSGSSETDSYYDAVLKGFNYKSGQCTNDTDPPYEILNNDDSNSTSISSYEKLDKDNDIQMATKLSSDNINDENTSELTCENISVKLRGEDCNNIYNNKNQQ